MTSNWSLAAVLLAVALATGCSQQKPAEQAVDAAEQALAEVHELALKYAPKEYGAVKAELDAARKSLTEGKYAEALAAARELPAKAKQVGEAAAAARDALAKKLGGEWDRLSGTMAARLQGLEARIAELDQAKRLPEGVERKAVDDAKPALEIAKKAWTDAEAAHGAGDIEGAVGRARGCELLVTRVMESLGVAQPAADQPAG